jgi:Phage tail protein
MREATFALQGLTFGAGTNYPLIGPVKGLPGSAGLRQTTTLRPQQDGAYAAAGFLGTRRITLEGAINNQAGGWGALWDLATALVAALTAKAPALLTVTTEDLRVFQTAVRTVAEVEVVELNTSTWATWQAQLEAVDPRLYAGGVASTASTGLPSGAGTGVTFPMTSPITFGVSPLGGSMSVINTGNTPTPWTATITGPVTNPQIEHVEQSRVLLFSTVLGSGEQLAVDADARTVLLGAASRYSTLAAPNWFLLNPGLNTVRFNAAGGTGTVNISWRSAWQ